MKLHHVPCSSSSHLPRLPIELQMRPNDHSLRHNEEVCHHSTSNVVKKDMVGKTYEERR